MQKKLRKYQNWLVVSGIITIYFGIWSLIKSLMYLLFDVSDIREKMQLKGDGQDYTFIMYITLGVILAIDLAIRMYVGLSAQNEGKGKKRGVLYLILAIVLVLLAVYSIYIYGVRLSVITTETAETSMAEMIVSVIVEISVLFTLGMLFYSAIRVKSIKKQLDAGEE